MEKTIAKSHPSATAGSAWSEQGNRKNGICRGIHHNQKGLNPHIDGKFDRQPMKIGVRPWLFMVISVERVVTKLG